MITIDLKTWATELIGNQNFKKALKDYIFGKLALSSDEQKEQFEKNFTDQALMFFLVSNYRNLVDMFDDKNLNISIMKKGEIWEGYINEEKVIEAKKRVLAEMETIKEAARRIV